MGRMERPLSLSSVFRLVLQAGQEVRKGTFTVSFLSVVTVPGFLALVIVLFLFACFVVVCFRARVGVKSISGSDFGAGSAGRWESGHMQCFQGKKSHSPPNLGLPLAMRDSVTRLLPFLAFPFWFSILLTLQVR